MPTLDPEVEHLLALGRAAGRVPFEAMTPDAARVAYAASKDVMQAPSVEVASVRDIYIPGLGGSLCLRLYRPMGTLLDEQLPCLVFLHGGGWVIGNLESHDRLCRRLANAARVCVVAVDYRLAPEHRFPAALDDAATALRWVVDNAVEMSIVPDRIAVGGDSAGGNLAAVLALMARDGTVPPLAFQALIYPAVDLTAASNSYQTMTAGIPLTAATMHYFIDHYTPEVKDRLDWHASPIKASSLAGTPPALVVTVSNDPLCDEGLAYARRLEEEGVRVTSLHLSDQIHGMLMMGQFLSTSNIVVDYIGATLGAALYSLTATD
ncbi:alpha/beta hydrolase [Glaciimonas sp. CA11.2]|uniref:alpha/beta hydrolase n=1 Tax=unclassified Glaciimonas TaxID=2644401 RepID=UPI002AB38970|nr:MULTISPECIES: alpha/beta hydrolase [unclassified Glaciimonas]MDY7545293.1 alpha/beta hydrolase [Glaciimonas sp. CA11.2]MEB0013836.1 alpha/beta hydrolase [Glaciimonas sp. Cout2]MEB0083061.1 alpha/beta hydrolase [Glaciimonas sp. Gout2]MEB0162431.1 alpha/beta hydrolase [Glaciimonas sp. CA11.2]